MNGDLAEILTTAEADGVESIEELSREAKFVDANRERCVRRGKEMYGVLARYTNSEALTIVKSVSEMDGVRAWRLHANYSGRTLGRMFRVADASACFRSLRRKWAKCDCNHGTGGEVGGDDV